MSSRHRTKLNLFLMACLSGLVCAGISSTATAKLYRWVDDQGNVHYSDKVPAQHSRSAREELSESGMVTKQVEAAKTAEEIAKEKELEKLRAEQKRLIELQRAKDNVLLRTFKTEDDILMARNGKIAAIDSNIKIVRSNIRRLKKKLEGMQKNAASLERQGKRISGNLLKDIQQTRNQLQESYTSIIEKEQEKEVIRNKAADDLARFRELKRLTGEREQAVEQQQASLLLDTVAPCDDKASCDQAWKNVEDYVRQHTTTRLQMLSDAIVMSSAPQKDNDVSITVSRIARKDKPGAADLFIDIQCRNTKLGEQHCESEPVQAIGKGFRSFVLSQ